jgi:hypothetical protein
MRVYERKKKPPVSMDSGSSQQQRIAELAKKVETLDSKVDILIAQIQMLHSEIRKVK